MSKKYSSLSEFEVMYLFAGMVFFVVLSVPFMLLLESLYRMGEEFTNLVQDIFFIPSKST